MGVVYPSIADVRRAHHRVIETSGGTSGLRDLNGLKSAVMRPRQTFGGTDLYPDLITKAAALFESLISNHPFVDGNKRTAVVIAEVFLEKNGVRVTASDDELVEFAVDTAGGKRDSSAIVAWFREHTVAD